MNRIPQVSLKNSKVKYRRFRSLYYLQDVKRRTIMKRHAYISEIASICYYTYGDDYYAAINAAESIALDPDCNDNKGDAAKVHAILEGEV